MKIHSSFTRRPVVPNPKDFGFFQVTQTEIMNFVFYVLMQLLTED